MSGATLAWLLVSLMGGADPPDGLDRPDEAELFGAPEHAIQPAPPAPADGDAAREADLFGEPGSEAPPSPAASSTAEERLAERDAALAVGGQAWMRLQYSWLDSSSPHGHPFASPNLVDVYLDARPGERVRFYVRGRVDHDPTVDDADEDAVFTRERTRVRLDQLWMKLDLGRRVFVTLGRQRIKWGAGRLWNPTDFLNETPLAPLSIFDERLGVSLLKVHLPVESSGWNFYALALLEGADTPEEIGGAARAEVVIGSAELTTSVVGRTDEPLRLGADLSSALGPFDVRLEGALRRGGDARRYEGAFDPSSGALPSEIDRSEDWLGQLSAGVELPIVYSSADSLYLSAEYAFNQNGYGDPDIYPWLVAQGAYTPFYVGRHYGAFGLVLPHPGPLHDTTFILSSVVNASDRSGLARFDVQTRALTHLQVYVFAAAHFGREGELRLRVDLPPVPGVAGLEEGLSVAPPRVDVGLWLSLSL